MTKTFVCWHGLRSLLPKVQGSLGFLKHIGGSPKKVFNLFVCQFVKSLTLDSKGRIDSIHHSPQVSSTPSQK